MNEGTEPSARAQPWCDIYYLFEGVIVVVHVDVIAVWVLLRACEINYSNPGYCWHDQGGLRTHTESWRKAGARSSSISTKSISARMPQSSQMPFHIFFYLPKRAGSARDHEGLQTMQYMWGPLWYIKNIEVMMMSGAVTQHVSDLSQPTHEG